MSLYHHDLIPGVLYLPVNSKLKYLVYKHRTFVAILQILHFIPLTRFPAASFGVFYLFFLNSTWMRVTIVASG